MRYKQGRLSILAKATGSPCLPLSRDVSVLLNLEARPEMDVTSLEMLEQLRSELSESSIDLCFARVADPVRDIFRRSGFLTSLGEKRIFPRIELAVDAFLESKPLTVHALSA